jgi:hypothetical protein
LNAIFIATKEIAPQTKRVLKRESVCVRVSRLFPHNNNYLKQSKIVSIFPLKIAEKKRVKI